ncbi:MAG: PAS domain S-box protein [Planctomycetaceae bacterium]|nr:PAS domain S-box protein [Planctomycetaceae bacterium]
MEDQREMIIRFDRNGRITFCNDAYAVAHGKTQEQLLGTSCFSDIHPDDVAEARRQITSVTPDSEFGFMQMRILLPDGSIGWREWNGRALYDENGQMLGYQGVGRDITALRRAEQRLSEKQHLLTHMARVSALGEMVAGISHEINQPLATIANFSSASQFVLEHDRLTEEDTSRLKTWAERIFQQTERISAIISRLRRFGRPGSRRERFLIGDAVRESLLVTEPHLRHSGGRVSVCCPDDLPQVSADRIQIEQVMVNLLRNACDAMADIPAADRRIEISGAVRDESIVVTICDSGPGLTGDQAGKIFDAFVTSKSDGMGIGLAISRSIVEAHGGRIRAIPECGRGCFEFSLPIRHSGDDD